ncbi:MAG: heavy-metal-associated domain-containing protein, partial [Bacteroidales bacterium]|nr:heavy-metal-associated domain-containing protein [Bacteroidales bacterium]
MKKEIKIEGMMCEHCAARVKKALEKLPGVAAEVSLEAKNAVITGDALDEAALCAAVTDAGYTVVSIA